MDRTPDLGDNPVIARSPRSWRLRKAQGTLITYNPGLCLFRVGEKLLPEHCRAVTRSPHTPWLGIDPTPSVLGRRFYPAIGVGCGPAGRIAPGRTDPTCLIEARRISRTSRRAGEDEEDGEGNGGRRRPSFRRLPKETVRRRTWPSPKSWYWSSFQSWCHSWYRSSLPRPCVSPTYLQLEAL